MAFQEFCWAACFTRQTQHYFFYSCHRAKIGQNAVFGNKMTENQPKCPNGQKKSPNEQKFYFSALS